MSVEPQHRPSEPAESPSPSSGPSTEKLKVLGNREYYPIVEFIKGYKGLAIECEYQLMRLYPQVAAKTLQCILQNTITSQMRHCHKSYATLAQRFLDSYAANPAWLHRCSIIEMSVEERVMPAGLCRAIIERKLVNFNKYDVTRVLKYPQLLKDSRLEECVRQALMSDTQEGPCIDLERRFVGEEYEYKLQQIADSYGLQYTDEKALRTQGFDKTPDLKLDVPFLYKGNIIMWLESKAMFADVDMHRHYKKNQYNCYTNRFGGGIVFYWHGFHKKLLEEDVSKTGIIILDEFPPMSELVFLKLDSEKFAIAK